MAVQWLSGPARIGTCPVCGATGQGRAILLCPTPPHSPGPGFRLAGCRGCGAAIFDPPPRPDYAASPAGGGGALAFYLQQGAGLWSIASALLALDSTRDAARPPRLLEIGCGFGFGLDFARRALGCEVRGYDPSPFAAAGRRMLGLPIETAPYDPASGPCGQDIILASELIEHLPDPVGFLRGLRAALAPGGVLVLTTPDAAAARPETPAGLLLPLLSPGYHTILHTAGSLERALRQAGFAHAMVEVRGTQLLACAADEAICWRAPAEAERRLYRDWLEACAASQPATSDLHLGFLGRAYREAVHAGDLPAADRLLPRLEATMRQRFCRRLDDWATADAQLPGSLEGLAARGPLSLGPLLLTFGLHRLLAEADRRDLLPLFDAAAREAAALRQALQEIGSDDGDAEEVTWTAGAEAALCAASAGEPDLAERLLRLGPAPSADATTGQARAEALRRRAFVTAVNAGAYAAAAPLSDVVGPAMAHAAAPGALLADGELDVLYCAATRAANAGAMEDLDEAVAGLRRLREAALRRLAVEHREGCSAVGLFWPAVALERELLARQGREVERQALAGPHLAELAARHGVPPRPADLEVGPG